jgi:hypothetical protein
VCAPDDVGQRSAVTLPAVLVVIATLAVGFQPMPFDPDLWFHLAGGEAVLTDFQVPETDPFSFTRAGELWMPHSWLFDALVALGWNGLGPRMTEAFAACAFAACFVLAFAILVRRRVNPLAALALCMGLAIAAGNTRGLRPQLLSMLLCSLLIWLLVRHRHRPDRRVTWCAPVIFLVWAQVHAACVMGLVVIVIWIAGRTLDVLLVRPPSHRGRELPALLAALALATLAVLVTPHRITHFEYVALTAGLEALHFTSEWQPPRPMSLEVPDVYLYALMAGVIAVLARRARRVGWAELLLCLALLMLGFSGVRHIPLACIASVPLFAAALGRDCWEEPEVLNALHARRGALLVAGAVMLTVLWRYPSPVSARYAAAEPVAGARALAVLGQPRNVFTTYNTGSYVLFSAPGALRVFIDSRADVYGDELAADARNVQRGLGWKEMFARWNIDAAVLQRDDPLAAILLEEPDWQLLAEDTAALTFVRCDSLPSAV